MQIENEKDKQQSGEILMFVIFIIIFLMLFVSLFLSKTLVKQAKTANNVANTLQAYYLADTGAEYSLYQFKNVCSSSGSADIQLPRCIEDNVPAFVGTGGQCDIAYDTSTGMISVAGIYKGQTSRAIQLTWTK
jgi:hypothetical protein